MNNISLIILASGFSRRFVSNKLLYEFHGKKLIEYAFDKASAFLDVIVVTQYEKIKEMAESLGYHVVMNDHPEYGQGHSIALGVGACQNNACILMVADMPYLKFDTLKEMVSIQDGKHIVICEHNGILCNPMLLPKMYYDRAKQLCNDKGAKQIIGDDTYLTVSLSEEEFMDIDEKTETI